jgi:hypothetical protein
MSVKSSVANMSSTWTDMKSALDGSLTMPAARLAPQCSSWT